MNKEGHVRLNNQLHQKIHHALSLRNAQAQGTLKKKNSQADYQIFLPKKRIQPKAGNM